MFLIEEELKKLPGKPGVYIMHDGEGRDYLCGQGRQPEEPGAPVFPEQPQQRRQN